MSNQAWIKLGDWYLLIAVTDRQLDERCVKVLLLEPLPHTHLIGSATEKRLLPIPSNEEIYCYFDGLTAINGMPVFVGKVSAPWSPFRIVL